MSMPVLNQKPACFENPEVELLIRLIDFSPNFSKIGYWRCVK
jgi:hypothetical protein